MPRHSFLSDTLPSVLPVHYLSFLAFWAVWIWCRPRCSDSAGHILHMPLQFSGEGRVPLTPLLCLSSLPQPIPHLTLPHLPLSHCIQLPRKLSASPLCLFVLPPTLVCLTTFGGLCLMLYCFSLPAESCLIAPFHAASMVPLLSSSLPSFSFMPHSHPLHFSWLASSSPLAGRVSHRLRCRELSSNRSQAFSSSLST